MQTDLPTLGAPIMIMGLLIGFFLCFYGNVAKKYLVPLRSVLSGAMVSLTLAFLLMQRDAFIVALQSNSAIQGLLDLLISRDHYPFGIVALSGIALGGLLLFALSRRSGTVASKIVAIFTALSMALFLLLLLLGFIPLIPSLVVTAVLLILILIFCMRDFTSYMVFENAIGGSLLISYLLARFWYLDIWLFLAMAVLISVMGILSQLHSLKRQRTMNGQNNE